jgi:hypothetical protein
MAGMVRSFLGTRPGFWVILAMEALFLFTILPRLLRTADVALRITFRATATLLYFSNYRLRLWLLRPKLPST